MTTLTPLKINDLPAEFEMQLPEAGMGLSWLVSGLGYIVLGVGVITLLIGPQTIYYNALQGMNFLQMIQAYPGPIASVGLLIVGVGQFFANGESAVHAREIAARLEEHVQITDEEIPEGYKLELSPLGNNRYSIALVAQPKHDEQSPQSPS